MDLLSERQQDAINAGRAVLDLLEERQRLMNVGLSNESHLQHLRLNSFHEAYLRLLDSQIMTLSNHLVAENTEICKLWIERLSAEYKQRQKEKS